MTDPQLICPRCGKDVYPLQSSCHNCGSDSLRYKDGYFECSKCGIYWTRTTCDYCFTKMIVEKCYKPGGCYIATSVYGSYDCPEVWTLRRFRDYTLAPKWYGKLFIRVYYAISPTFVKLFGNSTWFKKMWIKRLNKMVNRLNENGISNKPYKD
ncbi:MAG: hypothetical protein LBM93_09550 [Oscillospiraceae bacterium]|jgi:hypothetical protein|nr:hypothetical protein [Oscillospiraceae bacterium]